MTIGEEAYQGKEKDNEHQAKSLDERSLMESNVSDISTFRNLLDRSDDRSNGIRLLGRRPASTHDIAKEGQEALRKKSRNDQGKEGDVNA